MQAECNPSSQRMLSIGEISILLRSSHSPFWPFADKRYRNFYTSEQIPLDETIDLRVVNHSDLANKEPNFTSVSENNGIVRMIRGNGVAEWNKSQHTAWIEQSYQDFLPPAQYPEAICDSFLRIMLSYRLIKRDGMLIHGAGLVRNGKGYLFVGESGAGKSTVARCSSHMSTVLSDDLTIAYLTEKEGRIFGSPFFGEYATAGANLGAPLVGIYFLHQATENKIVPVAPQIALPKLLRSTVFFGEDKSSTERVLGLAMAFCTQVACHDLHFLPNDSFWRCINV